MGGSQKDIELLAASTSHDSARFNQIINRLRKEAYGIATAMGIEAEGAVEQAIQKATDWLGSKAPFNVNHPYAYIKTLVHNAVVDYGRTHKGETQSQLSESEAKALVTQIEGGSWDEGERNERAESPGYRVTKERPTKYVEGSYTKALKRQFKEEGVGRYATNAVLSFSHARDVPMVDTNFARLIERVFGFQSSKARARDDSRVWEFAEKLIPRGKSRQFNLAVLDFAATVCKSRAPDCKACPVQRVCMHGIGVI